MVLGFKARFWPIEVEATPIVQRRQMQLSRVFVIKS